MGTVTEIANIHYKNPTKGEEIDIVHSDDA